ncbi:MAG: adenylyltransferase/cytidyltransferase family protein, partial [Lachnospiraceae bacterium]|nr:adenylyltransferase/cytidyltransferase family protein [Lachnospiraceae bacterium]
MIKVITYGTYDLLHYGHIRLLERAKALGDYLIVGVTSDDYDKTRGKFNIQQSLNERLEAVRAIGLADEVIVEEYEGQKIDDIRRMDVDIFAVGSDWVGYFDYLKEYCNVVYLDRTQGVSSSIIRSQRRLLSIGLVGDSSYLNKVSAESLYVNGIQLSGVCCVDDNDFSELLKSLPLVTSDYEKLLEASDAVYIHSVPQRHYDLTKMALMQGKHVFCESPLALCVDECRELYDIARENKCVLLESLRTAFSTAFNRLVLLVKGGKIGRVVSVDVVCTSLRVINPEDEVQLAKHWNSITAWGPTALLPIFELLGAEYKDIRFSSCFLDSKERFDSFTKVTFVYPKAVASIKVGNGVKSEGELIISGTEGYVYVPAPWWKTDYFETRYEDPTKNKKYFYQLDGEGIRYGLAEFAKMVDRGGKSLYMTEDISMFIAE